MFLPARHTKIYRLHLSQCTKCYVISIFSTSFISTTVLKTLIKILQFWEKAPFTFDLWKYIFRERCSSLSTSKLVIWLEVILNAWHFGILFTFYFSLKNFVSEYILIGTQRYTRICQTYWKRLHDVFKTFLTDTLKTFWRRLQDVLPGHLEYVRKGSSRYHENVFKTPLRCLEEILMKLL